MSYLANGHTDTLPVPGDEDGATVTFRASATWDDERRLARRVQELTGITDDGERGYAFRAERTLLMVESWTLTDAQGDLLPLTAATLSTGLHRRVAAWIDEEAERRFEGRSEGEEGPFDSRSQPPSMGTT